MFEFIDSSNKCSSFFTYVKLSFLASILQISISTPPLGIMTSSNPLSKIAKESTSIPTMVSSLPSKSEYTSARGGKIGLFATEGCQVMTLTNLWNTSKFEG